MAALDAYLQFILDNAPYFYYIPNTGPDITSGCGAAAAAFAIDFLYEAYLDKRFESRKGEIYNKIVALGDWLLTQQCTNNAKKAYGGFKSNENSTWYYSIDACRAVPSLLKAYELTKNGNYLNSAKLAGATFLKTMQEKQDYGGFARAVDINDNWLLQVDVECLYGFLGLKMLCDYDEDSESQYQSMMAKASSFLRKGFENLWLYYDPADDEWHRLGLDESVIYDDSFAYALVGLYTYEGWSLSCEKVYDFVNGISASADYAGYNPNICWAGYIDVVKRKAACNYYDAVTSGILCQIRAAKDKPSHELSFQTINTHYEKFMSWGVTFTDYAPVENKQSVITVSWLGLLLMRYQPPRTRFRRFLERFGENITLHPIVQNGETVFYGESINIKAITSAKLPEEIIIESGYARNDFLTLYTFIPMRTHDKIIRQGIEYEVGPVQLFRFKGEPDHYRAVCRRLIAQ